MIEVRHLHLFLQLAQSVSTAPATRQVQLGDPEVQQSLTQLEMYLGVPLFTQGRGAMRLTPAGRIFQIEAAATVSALQRAEEQTRRAPLHGDDTLVIACEVSAAHPTVARTLANFRQDAPGATLVQLDKSVNIQKLALLSREVDASFMYVDVDLRLDTRLGIDLLTSEAILAVLPSGHPLAANTSISLQQLAGEPLVIAAASLSVPIRRAILLNFSNAGITPRTVVDIPSVEAGVGLVHLGKHLGFVPEGLLPLVSSDFVVRPIVRATQRVHQALLWNADNPSPLVAQLRQSAQSTVQAYPLPPAVSA